VACFFFLSGFGLATAFKTKGNDYIHGFIRRRMFRLLPPFLLLTLVAIIYLRLCCGISLRQQTDDLIHGIPPLATSWYIYAQILFYFAFYLIARSTHSPQLTAWYICIFLIIYIATLYKIGFGGYWISSAPSFATGYIMSIYRQNIIRFMQRHRIVAATLAVTLIASTIAAAAARQIFQPLMTTALSLSVYICLLNFRLPSLKPLDFLGGISYEIYLMQGLMFTIRWPQLPYMQAILIPTASIVGAWMLNRLFNLNRKHVLK